jgi:hypothetical protein
MPTYNKNELGKKAAQYGFFTWPIFPLIYIMAGASEFKLLHISITKFGRKVKQKWKTLLS